MSLNKIGTAEAVPTSVEEAAALLGASITRISNETVYRTNPPPSGLHTSFSTVHPVPCSELFVRLTSLHALLRRHAQVNEEEMNNLHHLAGGRAERNLFLSPMADCHDKKTEKKSVEPLAAAPSILQLLHKLLAISSSLALNPVLIHSSANSLPSNHHHSHNLSAVSNHSHSNSKSTTSDSSSNSSSNATVSQNEAPITPNRGTYNNHQFSTPNSKHIRHTKQALSLQVPPIPITPPLSSKPLRQIWIQCIALSHRFLDPKHRTAASTGTSVTPALARYLEIAAAHPRSAKSLGGTRIACLGVLTTIFSDVHSNGNNDILLNWSGDVISTCHKALKSSGAHDVLHRVEAVKCALSVCIAIRRGFWCRKKRMMELGGGNEQLMEGFGTFWCKGAMEDKVILECVKLLRKASEDKYSEVRLMGVEFACVLCSMLVHDAPMLHGSGLTNLGGPTGGSSGGATNDVGSNITASLDEVMIICFKNLDDESAAVSVKWSEAFARCICTAVEYNSYVKKMKEMETSSTRNAQDADESDVGGASAGGGSGGNSSGIIGGGSGSAKDLGFKFKAFSESRKTSSTLHTAACISLSSAMQSLVQCFVKVGGEFSASKLGGTFSTGGRNVRVGIYSVLIQLCKFQSVSGGIGRGLEGGLSANEVLKLILDMVGPGMEQQLVGGKGVESSSTGFSSSPSAASLSHNGLDKRMIGDAPTTPKRRNMPEKISSSSLFSGVVGGNKYRSPFDACLVRMAAGQVLRRGLSEMASEPTQLSLLRDLASMCLSSRNDSSQDGSSTISSLNRHQLQVALVEISHLVTTLGEASASSLDDVIPALELCLSDIDHGVRHEAAIAFQAIIVVFPSVGRKFIMTALDKVQLHRDEIFTLASHKPNLDEEEIERYHQQQIVSKRRFRRGGNANKASSAQSLALEKSLEHQYSVHGNGLVLSVILHELPHLPGGLPSEILDVILAVAESLVLCQGNETLAKNNPGAVCTCVRAGYCIVSGALSIGPRAISSHLPAIFRMWSKSGRHIVDGTKYFEPTHEISCLDPMLTSLVAFLQTCSVLLLSIPDALNRTTHLLEKLFPVVSEGGRLGGEQANALASSRLDSARASMMEAFSWLPPGSFPLMADTIFSFAARQIQNGTEHEISCSILSCLVTSEDNLLNVQSLNRANAAEQTGGSEAIEEHLISLTSDCISHAEREAVLHFLTWRRKKTRIEPYSSQVFSSSIMEFAQREEDLSCTPTPLHEVGTWKKPPSPSSSSKVRLMDSAIHVFAATFGLQDGHQQEKAVRMLETLIASSGNQSSKTFSSSLVSLRLNKLEDAADANAAATLLLCLQALPLHEGSSDNIIGMGPPWMTRAMNLFYTFLPSAAPYVRRVAAEGLALLASLGVTEDAHTLQSSILHSLEKLMQGNLPDSSTPRKSQVDLPTSSLKAGSLLTLGCLQRTAQNMSKETARARARFSGSRNEEAGSSSTPTMIMLTRILPYLATHAMDNDSFLTRTYALHSFGLVLSYSNVLDCSTEKESYSERNQILSKAVEIVENNFFAAWTTFSSETENKGREAEKFAMEPAFLSVLIRLMTFLLPRLHLLSESDVSIANRFYNMSVVMIETSNYHPSVVFEGIVFHEHLCSHLKLLGAAHSGQSFSFANEVIKPSLPMFLKTLLPDYPQTLKYNGRLVGLGFEGANLCRKAAVACINLFSTMTEEFPTSLIVESKLHIHLFSLLEIVCGSKKFTHTLIHRNIAAPRGSEGVGCEALDLELETILCIESLICLESKTSRGEKCNLLHLILFARALLVGDANTTGEHSENVELHTSISSIIFNANKSARYDAAHALMHCSPSRWQVKFEATKILSMALMAASKKYARAKGGKADFDIVVARSEIAKSCREMMDTNKQTSQNRPLSYIVFHLEDLISAACSATIATLDQAELLSLQSIGLRLLFLLVSYFSHSVDPDESGGHNSSHRPKLLERFTSQIVPSLKQALSSSASAEENCVTDVGLSILFITGCEGLHLVTEVGLIPDLSSMKRLIKPIIPSREDVIFCAYPDNENDDASCLRSKPISFIENRRASLLTRLGKLCAVAEIIVSAKLDLLPETFASLVEEEIRFISDEVAVNCAALAIDGARMKASKNTLFHGKNMVSLDSGLTYSNIQDIDENVQAAMVKNASVLASFSAISIVDLVKSRSEDDKKRALLFVWLKQLIPVLFTCLYDGLNSLRSGDFRSDENIYSEKICAVCLKALSVVLGFSEARSISNPLDVKKIVLCLSEAVIKPCLNLVSTVKSNVTQDEFKSCSTDLEHNYHIDESTHSLVLHTCTFIKEICISENFAEVCRSTVMKVLLPPIIAWQDGKITFDENSQTKTLILSCILHSIRHIIRDSRDDELAKIMFSFTFFELSKKDKSIYCGEEVKEAAISLFRHCTSMSLFDKNELLLYTKQAAKLGSWGAWEILCSNLDNYCGIISSLNSIQEALADLGDIPRHFSALSATCNMVSKQRESIPYVLEKIGMSVIQILKYHGLISSKDDNSTTIRIQAFSESVKMIMLSLQYLISEGLSSATSNTDLEGELTAFLVVLFEVFTSVISHNGLPNQIPSKVDNAEPNIGRMCAQSFVHVLRVSPNAFKSSLNSLSVEDRNVLEVAVRLDMSGYPVPKKAGPTKKKLNLKSFNKA